MRKRARSRSIIATNAFPSPVLPDRMSHPVTHNSSPATRGICGNPPVATITEMDFLLDEKPQRLYFVGLDNELIGDWSLLNPERLALAGVAVFLLLIALITGVLLFF
ncbi:MAG: hypothetical protein HGA19_16600 [Oscillochloris sp.]|nr:hypothetical protein [Oscillochloris sp.]